MLVLSRKSLERIEIGDNVVVTVLAIHGSKVRIGISAPREIRVLRSELKEVIPDLPSDRVSDVRALGSVSVEKALPDVLHN